MKKQQSLGIHLTPHSLHAVLLQRSDNGYTLCADWSYPGGNDELSASLTQLAQELHAQHGRSDIPVSLALGADYYQTQNHRSEFTDPKMLDQTLKYDVEELFAMSSDSMAMSYQFRSRDEDGSDLLVYAAPRDRLTAVFDLLEQANLDAIEARPDIAAWLTYLQQYAPSVTGVNAAVGYADGAVYVLFFDESFTPLALRSSLCPDPNAAVSVLERELLRSTVLLQTSDTGLSNLYVHSDGLDTTEMIHLVETLKCSMTHLPEVSINKAFALGAALARLSKRPQGDFRRDDLEPQTQVKSRRQAWWALSAAVTLFMLVWGTVMQVNVHHYQQLFRRYADNKVAACEMAIGKAPRNVSQINSVLKSRKNELKKTAAGQAADGVTNSASGTLALVFEALGTLPDDFDLKIESLRSSDDDAMLSGSVLDLQDRIELDAVIKRHPRLEVANWDVTQNTAKSDKTVRRSFNMSLKVKNN